MVDYFIDNQGHPGSRGADRHRSLSSGGGGTSYIDPSEVIHILFLF